MPGTHYVAGMSETEFRRKYNVDEIIKLGSNENPIGPSPKAVAAMKSALQRAHRYPPMTDDELRGSIAGSFGSGITPENVVTGNGACDVLSMISNTYLNKVNSCIICRPPSALSPICRGRRQAASRAQVYTR